jgi:phosphate transport system substrate-binding protein
MRNTIRRWAGSNLAIAAVAIGLSAAGCSHPGDDTIKLTGSDTMVNLAQAWAETFPESHPDIFVQIKGGGTGVGIAALCAGKIQVATASRPIKPKEIALAQANNDGKTPREFIVGRDALAIYVHKRNPLETISLGQLAEVYGEGGKITTWQQLGVDNPQCRGGQIIRVARQNSSGTYAYFRDAVLGKGREYKQGATSQSGSSDVVGLISSTPCAIGYSGMGYNSDDVKVLKVSKKEGQPGVEPTLETTLDNTYPISRPLYIYTLGDPQGAVREFVQWILSPDGQKIVQEKGYVPVTQHSVG